MLQYRNHVYDIKLSLSDLLKSVGTSFKPLLLARNVSVGNNNFYLSCNHTLCLNVIYVLPIYISNRSYVLYVNTKADVLLSTYNALYCALRCYPSFIREFIFPWE